MPVEADYNFGKRAVKAGRLRQDQLEECVEILVALERVGSAQRLWDIVRRKGYMGSAAIAEIKDTMTGPEASVLSPAPPPAEETGQSAYSALSEADPRQGRGLRHCPDGAGGRGPSRQASRQRGGAPDRGTGARPRRSGQRAARQRPGAAPV